MQHTAKKQNDCTKFLSMEALRAVEREDFSGTSQLYSAFSPGYDFLCAWTKFHEYCKSVAPNNISTGLNLGRNIPNRNMKANEAHEKDLYVRAVSTGLHS